LYFVGAGRFDETEFLFVGGDIMKWIVAGITGVVLSLSTASTANAQVYWGGRSYYNPWTGGAVYRGGVYSPWTGYYGGGVGYNPWVGRYYGGNAFVNPYMGASGYSRNWYNPWTGRYGYRYRVW
jgi:hypothetical protein